MVPEEEKAQPVGTVVYIPTVWRTIGQKANAHTFTYTYTYERVTVT